MYAPYNGSHLALVRLCMHLVLPCKAADPCRVAPRKGWESCNLIRGAWGEDEFKTIWHGSSSDRPLRSFRLLLARLPRPAAGLSLEEAFLERAEVVPQALCPCTP
jgi:hypothetical protein